MCFVQVEMHGYVVLGHDGRGCFFSNIAFIHSESVDAHRKAHAHKLTWLLVGAIGEMQAVAVRFVRIGVGALDLLDCL